MSGPRSTRSAKGTSSTAQSSSSRNQHSQRIPGNQLKENVLENAKPSVRRALTLKLKAKSKKLIVSNAHPTSPVSSSKVFYNQNWAAKQESTFTAWLNHTLRGSEDVLKASSPLLIYTMKEEALLRRKALALYHSLEVTISKLDREIYNKPPRICVRHDRDINSDLGLRNQIEQMLFAFAPRWLTLALETVFHRIIRADDKGIEHGFNLFLSFDSHGLATKQFLKERFFADTELGQQFELKQHSDDNRSCFREGYVEELKKLTLGKFIKIVFFLDRAKACCLLESDPCLFVKSAPFKSTREVMVEFARSFLSGEGDVIRHLSLLGCEFVCRQTQLDEFDFKVQNLAIDLRDGVRLAKVADLSSKATNGCLFDDKSDEISSIMKQLRLPADSRLRKIHNVQLSLKALISLGVPIKIDDPSLNDEYPVGVCTHSTMQTAADGLMVKPEHIVDGHRSTTLNLLWSVILNQDLKVNLKAEVLRREIQTIRGSRDGFALEASCKSNPDEPLSFMLVYMACEQLQLLLEWVNAVCIALCPLLTSMHQKKVRVPVHNFTSSFADGRVLCLLIHYYHPTLLPLETIQMIHGFRPDSDLTSEELEQKRTCNETLSEQHRFDLHKFREDREKWSAFYRLDTLPETQQEQNATAARNNVRRALECADQLGCPTLLRIQDLVEGLPEERVVIIFVAHLCRRLLGLSTEIRATRKLQRFWRKYLVARSDLRPIASRALDLAESSIAAKEPLSREFQQIDCVVASADQEQQVVGTEIQGEKKSIQFLHAATIAPRALCSSKVTWIAQEDHGWLQSSDSAPDDYECFHHFLPKNQEKERNDERETGKDLEGPSQRNKQRWPQLCPDQHPLGCVETFFRSQEQAAMTLQSVVRCCQFQKRLVTLKSVRNLRIPEELLRAVNWLQQRYRSGVLAKRDRKQFIDQHRAVRVLQSCWRRITTNRKALQIRSAAVVKLQAWLRGAQARKEYRVLGEQKRESFLQVTRNEAASAIQRWFRSGRLKILRVRSVVVIQRYFRRFLAKKQLESLRFEHQKILCAVITLQCAVRSWRARIRAQHLRIRASERLRAVVVIQTAWRAFMARSQASRLQRLYLLERQRNQAAVCIQQRWLAYLACFYWRKRFLELRNATLIVQAVWRTQLAFRQSENLKTQVAIKIHAVVRIQSFVRSWLARQKRKEIFAARKLFTEQAEAQRQEEHKTLQRITLIQALWRGRRIRTTCSLEVQRVSRRLHGLSNAPEENRVGNRLKSALKILLESKQLTVVTNALRTLDNVTRLLPCCCVDAVDQGAVGLILALIRSCNRSQPHLVLLKHGLNVLRNIACSPSTCREVFRADDFLEVMVEIMQVYRDKEDIFGKAVNLVRIGTKLPGFTKFVKSHSDTVRRIESIFAVISHKLKIEENQHQPGDVWAQETCKAVKRHDMDDFNSGNRKTFKKREGDAVYSLQNCADLLRKLLEVLRKSDC